MGDDAEFQIEFEKYGAWWEDLDSHEDDCPDSDSTGPAYLEAPSYFGGTPLFVLDEGLPLAIWGWDEAIPIPFTLEDLHLRWEIGDRPFKSGGSRKTLAIDNGRFQLPGCDNFRDFEVIVVTHDDEILLDMAAAELMLPNRPLRERMIGEMLQTMLRVVQGSPASSQLVFARAIEQSPRGI